MNNNLEGLIATMIEKGFKNLRKYTLESLEEEIKKINYYDFFNSNLHLSKDIEKNRVVISESNINELKKTIDKHIKKDIDITKEEIEEFRKSHSKFIKKITYDDYYISEELIIKILKRIKKEITIGNNHILKEIYDSEIITTVLNENKEIITSITNDYVCRIFVKTFEKIYNEQFEDSEESSDDQSPFSNNYNKTEKMNISNIEQCLFILGIQENELFKSIDNKILEKIDRHVTANILILIIEEDNLLNRLNYIDFLSPKNNNISEENIITYGIFMELSDKYEEKFNKRPGIPEPSSYSIEYYIKLIIKCLESGCDDYEKIAFSFMNTFENNILY